MKIKNNITVQDRIDFVNFVINTCEIDGRHVHALFDFAWRTAVIMWFTDKDLSGLNQDEVCDYVYSKEGIEVVNDPDIAEVVSGLYEACTEEIKDRHEEFMVVFKDMSHPDPLDRIAAAFEEMSKATKQLNDPDMLVEIAKKAGIIKKQTKKAPRKQKPKEAIKYSDIKVKNKE